jgi:predicted nucleotidyltransferase component of viral defense system
MKRTKANQTILLHEDSDLFREAINFTAAQTSFLPRLIEKDYFSTVLLSCLAPVDYRLVFKGGTCLAKVHAGFYRLSEDLDFVISTPVDASRSTRSTRVSAIREALVTLPDDVSVFRLAKPLTGANNSTQYVAVVAYRSLLANEEEIIKIEIGLREPLMRPAFEGEAQTLLLNPVSGRLMVQPLLVSCIAFDEGMAEKFRAALTRREAAVRDFFDIDYAVRKKGLNPLDSKFIKLVQEKLAIPGNDPVDLSESRQALLKRQLHSHLRPVLQPSDFEEFNIDKALRTVTEVVERLGEGS